ncbi:helix-turn-helix transcriptional regulator [Clostridium sp. HCP1S3_B4]|uniref:helix-turn-helix transcriptional regulator n=1 Tax=unclassified Clostridium TaxID=2614128 RepID=UPI003F886E71
MVTIDDKTGKIKRTLGIYTRLKNGNVINKIEEANKYGVNERSIQRDIDDIRNYLELETDEQALLTNVIYDRKCGGYRLEESSSSKLTNSQILAICKILLDSRAFTKEEMQDMLAKLIDCCVPRENKDLIRNLIKNEEFHYCEPHHGRIFIDKLWTLGQAIQKCKYIEIDYLRAKDKTIVKRKLKPVAIMFSEYYFYLTAFIEDKKVRQHFETLDDSFPTIYRVDRIEKLKVLDERFHMPYSSRFEEGEFRKRIQFMYGGKLQKIKFKYSGNDIDSILDRLPTARILSEEDGKFIVSAEVFGKGIDMWIRSQGDLVEMLD